MSVDLARPLVPSDRETELGRLPGEPDFADRTVVISQPFDGYGGQRPATFWGRRKAYLRSLNPRRVDGPLLPLIVLSLIAFFGKLATDAAQLTIPEIQNDLGIDIASALGLIAITNTPFTVMRLYVGYFADRIHRMWMTRVAAVLRGAACLMVAGSTGMPTYVAGQLGQSAAETVSQPASFSLLTDFYPVHARPRVIFLLFQFSSISGILGFPIIGLVGGNFGWRAVYLMLGVGLFLCALLALAIKEPVRGYYDRLAVGADEEVARHEQSPLSFAESFRVCWSIRYIRILCFAAPFASVIALYSLVIQQTYLASEYGLGLTERGWITTITACFGTFGLLVVAPYAQRTIGSRPRVIVMISALQGLAGALVYFLLLAAHNLVLAVGVLCIEALIVTTIFPITFTLQNLVIPARIRGFGFQINIAFGALSFLLLTFGISSIASNASWTALFILIAVVNLVIAVIMPLALPHIENDISNALISSMADEELRTYRASGRNAMLLCRKVDVAYSGVQVLFGVDLDVAPGEVVALLGTNGAGKSTLLRAIAGVTEPTGGAIYVDGVDVTHKPPHESAAAGVVVVPGGRAVCHSLTVRENLRLAGWLRRDDSEYVEERLTAALDLFPRLRERIDTAAGDLSGGEQQMLAIAQSYLMEPRLLMIDELSLGLAPQVVESLLESVRAINATGTTILLVEQSINVALTIAQRAIFMEKGEIRFDGSTAELLSRPDLVRSVFMGGAATGGRTRRRAVSSSTESLLEVTDLSVSFGTVQALSDVSLRVAPREIVGFIGPNGAGKTTLFDAISGLVPTDNGVVTLKGVDVSRLTLDGRAALGLGRSFQNARLFPSVTVRENIAIAMHRRIRSKNPLLAASWAPPVRLAERKVKERVDDIVELLGLKAYADKFVGELSTGSRRAVDVGCIMVASPDLLLLDEPSSGLAQAESEALGPLIQRIVRETGCGVLIIEHDLPLITSVSDRLVAMELGRVIATGTPEAVTSDPEVQRAYLAASREVLLRSDSAFGAALAAAGITDVAHDPTLETNPS
ncbi:MAG: MFS transporter [Frankiaceae bacterium]|nr:MFS transporter [Frankiaceae bacterium]